MSENKMAWLERFNRDAGIKSSIILFGNTDDIYFDSLNNGKYDSLVELVIRNLKKKGYEKVVKWDRVSGIDSKLSDKLELSTSTDTSQTDGKKYEYDFEDDSDDNSSAADENTNT